MSYLLWNLILLCANDFLEGNKKVLSHCARAETSGYTETTIKQKRCGLLGGNSGGIDLNIIQVFFFQFDLRETNFTLPNYKTYVSTEIFGRAYEKNSLVIMTIYFIVQNELHLNSIWN